MKNNGISRMERLLREAVEGSFGRLFGGHVEPMDVAVQLVQVMEDSTTSAFSSAAYEIALHPADYELLLEQNPSLADDLADAAWKLARRYGLALAARPKIDIVEDQSLRRHAFQISRKDSATDMPGLDTTQIVDRAQSVEKVLASIREVDAFLIIQGRRHVALDKALITIGRRPDNDIVLDSASVSRQHAQIRWRFDRFVLYHVSNRARTKVNGEVVSEHVLRPGDVIALSDAMLIYGEGIERDRPRTEKQPEGNTHTLIIPDKRA